MKRIELRFIAFFIYLSATVYSSLALAIEEKFYNLSINDSLAIITETLDAKNNPEIKIDVQDSPEKMVTIDFTPPRPFTLNSKDLFEQIKVNNSGDVINYQLIVSDPKSGRIFHMTTDLKVSKLELLKPWETKNKLKSIIEILTEMHNSKIQLMPKKNETKTKIKAEMKK